MSNIPLSCHIRFDSLATYPLHLQPPKPTEPPSRSITNMNIHTSLWDVSRRRFRLGGIRIAHQMFGEATHVAGPGTSWDPIEDVAGVLGLTSRSYGAMLGISNPFMRAAEQCALDRNAFSLRLVEPRGIMFGTTSTRIYIHRRNCTHHHYQQDE